MKERSPEEVQKVLQAIPVTELSYDDWLHVGMALKNEGYSFDLWNEWSQQDERYKPEEMGEKWNGFNRHGYGMGTVMNMAFKHGYRESMFTCLDPEPVQTSKLAGFQQSIHYLETIFKPGEIVCFESSSSPKEPGKYSPNQISRRKFMERDSLIEFLGNGKIPENYFQPAGMWILHNPTDGKGRSSENVTAFRHVLVESDQMEIAQQLEWFRRSGLPYSCLLFSGGRSIHALVKVDASTPEEYDQRARRIFKYCEDSGMKIDKATKNKNRLSRFPGFMRGDRQQTLIEVNPNAITYREWEISQIKTEIKVYTGNDFETKQIEWLIPGAIPLGGITLFGGVGASGKGSLTCDLIAGLIKGTPCAFDFGQIHPAREPKRVLYFSSEDDFDIFAKPRLVALGCERKDFNRLWLLPKTDSNFSSIKYNSDELFQLVDRIEPDLIVFDPLQAFLPDSVDMSKRNHMRNIFQEMLSRIGERKIAVLIICHCNKSLQFSGVDRVADSKDITDLARSVFLLGDTRETDDSGNQIRYLSHEKSNYSRQMDTILFRIENAGSNPVTGFDVGLFKPINLSEKKDFDFTVAKRIGTNEKQTKSDSVKETILKLLEEGPAERAKIMEETKDMAKETTVKKVLHELKDENLIESETTGKGETKRTFYRLSPRP